MATVSPECRDMVPPTSVLSEQGGALGGCLRWSAASSSSLAASQPRLRELESISSSDRGSGALAISARAVSCTRESGLAWGAPLLWKVLPLPRCHRV